MTFPIDGMEAGLIYDVPDKKAQEYIEGGVARMVEDENLVPVTSFSDEKPVYIEGRKKKVKDGER